MLYIIGDFLLYISISLVTGTLLLNLVSQANKPVIRISKRQFTFFITVAIIFAFFPVLKLIVYFVSEFNYDVIFVTKRVLLDYNIGHGWIITAIFSIVLLILSYIPISPKYCKSISIIKLLLATGMIAGIGYASHSASLYGFKGFVVHSLHLLGVSLWLGTLIVAAWFSRKSDHWENWISWMSPFSFICFVVTIASGIYAMVSLSDSYAQGLIVPFGQALLIKHAFLVPLTALAITNSVGLRSKLKKEVHFTPVKWLRIETLLAGAVFFNTAILSEQNPPHNLVETFPTGEIKLSKIWTFFKGADNRLLVDQIRFHHNPLGVSLGFLSVLLILFGVYLMIKQKRIRIAICVFFLSALPIYFAVLVSVYS